MARWMITGWIMGWIFSMATGGVCAQERQQAVPFTLADRDRLVRIESQLGALENRGGRLEARMDRLESRMDRLEARMDRLEARMDRLESRINQIEVRLGRLEARIDQMMTFMWILATVFAGLVAAVIGITIWDRRTALAPALRRTDAVAERLDRIERALQALAEQDPRIAEALHQAGLI